MERLPSGITITSPAAHAPVSATTAVQLSSPGDGSVARVDLYARARGGSGEGALVGSTTQEPFVISWYTPAQPNLAELELVAVAVGRGGAEAASAPVPVRVQNSGVPTLDLLTAYTVPPDPAVQSLGLAARRPPAPTAGATPPRDAASATVAGGEAVAATAEDARDLVLEWQWSPYAGADGYGAYLAGEDLAGPYALQVRQAATAGTGSQTYSRTLPDAAVGDRYHGVVSAVTSGATLETGFSNGDGATFLPAQAAVSPADGALLGSGRPSFTWSATPGAIGYLYYVYDKDPWQPDATLLWSNYPQSTAELSASWPAERAALASGTYWWWVAGVSFDAAGAADAFTFSEPRTFTVP